MTSFKTTMVSMFFNLKKLKDQTVATRPIEFYIQQCAHVLRLPYPLVLFCDNDTIDMLRDIRTREVGDRAPTEYIAKDISDYDFYSNNWSIVHENRARYNPHAYKDSRNTTSYCLLTMFKCIALLTAKQKNFFNSDYYAWVDIGCNHIARRVSEYAPKMLDNPNPKVSACYIHYRDTNELQNMREYMRHGGFCGVAATTFTVQKEYVELFYTRMMSVFYEMISQEVGHSEETVMTYLAHRYPDMFTFYNGDYYSVFTNYHAPREDIHAIIYLYVVRADEKHAREASQRLLDAEKNGLITLSDEFRSKLRL